MKRAGGPTASSSKPAKKKARVSGASSAASTPQRTASNSEDDVAELNLEAQFRSDESDDHYEPDFVSDQEDEFEAPDREWQDEDEDVVGGPKAKSKANGKGKASSRRQPLRAKGKVLTGKAARHRARQPDSDDDELALNDFTNLPLRADHASRPFWVMPLGRTIILEAFHPLAAQAADFLIAIAEPISRPQHIHEYKLTTHSLYAAVSVGLDTNDIIDVLSRLSKVPVADDIINFIRDCTESYGKVKLVLKHNRYYVESSESGPLKTLLDDKAIRACKVDEGAEVTLEKAPTKGDLVIPGTSKPAAPQPAAAEVEDAEPADPEAEDAREAEDLFGALVDLDKNDDRDIDDEAVHAFEIKPTEVEVVKREALRLEYPMLEEYDFRNDRQNADLEIDLKPTTTIRPYQEKSLSKMFGNGRARSGIIVLPCGAGKTLVGITAACTIKKSVIVLCTSSVSVMQWKTEFQRWSTLAERQIAVFTSDHKEKFTGAAGIVVSTYSMVANRQKRSHDAQKMMEFLTSREWGFIILDEVHVVPAAMFRQVVTVIKAHCKLGLTATLVREDDKIDDLNFLIGPKLYEANWMDLAEKGHIAKVQCAEVWCHMSPEFYREYLREKSSRRRLLYVMNPRKFQSCQFLIKYHEDRGDKVIVFSDNVFALEAYAKKLGKPFIHGGIAQLERIRILQNFQHNPVVNTIFLSKVGDTSIDLPEATCLIQISSHFGSRRQEAQRLGRILRAKRRNDEGFNAFFYSLVSRDCEEMKYSSKRQQFLIDQGYAFKVISDLPGIDTMPDLVYPTKDEQIELLQSVLLAKESAGEIGVEADAFASGTGKAGRSGVMSTSAGKKRVDGAPAAKRVAGSLNALSGATTMSYIEQNRSANSALKQSHHKLFDKKMKAAKDRKKKREAEQEN